VGSCEDHDLYIFDAHSKIPQDRKIITVHTEMLRRDAPKFWSIIEGFKNSKDPISIDFCDPTVFSAFTEWLYAKSFATPAQYTTDQLILSYCLGHSLECNGLMNLVMDVIRDRLNKTQTYLSSDQAASVFIHLPPDEPSPLKKFCVLLINWAVCENEALLEEYRQFHDDCLEYHDMHAQLEEDIENQIEPDCWSIDPRTQDPVNEHRFRIH
jgi:hypothetical protein